jgi:hypothetical protein
VCCSLNGRGFTLQAAVNKVRQSLQSEVEKFVHSYKTLVGRTCDDKDLAAVANAMRDCVTGFMHWIYEGERYYGKQYEEVAKFGWIFMGSGGTIIPSDGVEVPAARLLG